MRRTGISPGSRRLQRRASVIKPVSAKREAAGKPQRQPKIAQRPPRPPGEFTDAVKLLIRKRAGRGYIFDAECESCGTWLGEKGGEYSHRDARGMGGSRDLIVNGPAGGTLACGSGAARTGCHGLCEDRDDDMNVMGFWLKNGQDPLTEPIVLHGRSGGQGAFYLAADGLGPDGTGYLLQRPEAAAA